MRRTFNDYEGQVARTEDSSVEFEYALDEDIVCSIGKAYSRCLSVPAWNNEPSGQKDFDGDQMFGILALDAWTADELRYLAPHFGGWSLTKPRTVNENMAMPKPVVASAVSWIYDYPERARRPDPAKLDWMKRKFTIRSLNA